MATISKTGTQSRSKAATQPKTGMSKMAAAQAKPTTSTKKPNPNTEFAQDMVKLDDVAIASDILKSEKALISRYSVALTEVSCDKLRNLIKTHLSECACDQLDTFNYMNQRNQYPTEPAPANKVSQAKQKYTGIKNKMSK